MKRQAGPQYAKLLADCGIENIPTCRGLCLDCDAENWQSLGSRSGTLVGYNTPKKSPD